MLRVCFVCLGNICRSPTAEGVMRQLLRDADLNDQIKLDSAGTSAYHVGDPPDARSTAAAARRGITLSGASRQVVAEDFDRFDYIIAMDGDNLRALGRLARSRADRERIHLMRDFDPTSPPNAAVPDPYYGGENGFDVVLDICTASCQGLLSHLQDRLAG
ncbi:MAG: protein-tyrosine phosphatase [Myxococcota bacterium]|jgi:protein-tyrosine phosphatase